ncbi:MAG: YcxB family protein [Filifactoraceae bacterium]
MIEDIKNFEIEVTDTDYKNIVYFNAFKKERRMFFIFACVLISLFLIIVSIFRGEIKSYMAFGISLAVVILFFFQVVITQLKIKKFLKSNPTMINIKKDIKLNTEYISQSGKDGNEIYYNYENMKKAYELKSYFLIFTKNGKTLILPKRYMGNDTINYISNTLKERLGDDFELRKRS